MHAHCTQEGIRLQSFATPPFGRLCQVHDIGLASKPVLKQESAVLCSLDVLYMTMLLQKRHQGNKPRKRNYPFPYLRSLEWKGWSKNSRASTLRQVCRLDDVINFQNHLTDLRS